MPPGTGRLLLMIRPERLSVVEGAPPGGLNLFEGRVRDLVYQARQRTRLRDARRWHGSRGPGRLPQRQAFDWTAFGSAAVLDLHPDDTLLILDDGDRAA